MAIWTYEKNGVMLFEVYVGGKDARGQRVQKKKNGIKSLREAKAIEFELKRELAKLSEESFPYRWGEWLEECLKRMRPIHRPSTLLNYETQLRKWISPRWEKTEIRTIGKADVHKVIFEELDAKISPHTRRSILKMVKRVFEMAVEEGHLAHNPCAGVRVHVPEVVQSVLTNAEVGLFLREAKECNHRFYPVWVMALMTGMRSGELFALTWADLDLEGQTISVSKQWSNKYGTGPTKTQRNRVVPVSDELLKFLKELKLQKSGEHVLPRLKEWEHGDQAEVTREFCISIGVTPIKFHDLRATFITNLLSRGESLARVMAIVGHTQLETTNGYLRKAGVDLKGATDRLGYSVP